MGQSLALGIGVVFRPERGWAVVRDSGLSTRTLLAAYLLVFAVFPFLGRAVGHLLLDWEAGVLLLDAFLYPGFSFTCVLVLGFMLGSASPQLDGVDDRGLCVRLALVASTPLWLLGVLHAVPVPTLHTLLPLIGVAWTGWLLLPGVVGVLEVPTARAMLLVPLLFSVFTVGFVLLNQVVLTHLCAGG